MTTSTITAIHDRRAKAMRRNLFSVALSAQRQTICPHDDGRARAPIRRQAEDGSWGWWLPHPIRREVWDFVAEDLPNPVMEYKYKSYHRTYSVLSAPAWIQSPSGLWGWGVREEDFGPEVHTPVAPWTMYYYMVNSRGNEVLEEATVNMTVVVEDDLNGEWIGGRGIIPWESLQPEEGTSPAVGFSPMRVHRTNPFPSHPAWAAWNTLHLPDLEPSWTREVLIRAAMRATTPWLVRGGVGARGCYGAGERGEGVHPQKSHHRCEEGFVRVLQLATPVHGVVRTPHHGGGVK